MISTFSLRARAKRGISVNDTYAYVLERISNSAVVSVYRLSDGEHQSSLSFPPALGTRGLAIDDTYAYVLDTRPQSEGVDTVIVHRLSDGVRQNSLEFDLPIDNGGPDGISVNNIHAYVVGDDRHVSVYRLSDGARQVALEFNLHSSNGTPVGISINDTYAYVVDSDADAVYVYRLSNGARQSSLEFNLSGQNGSPGGISVDSAYAYVVDNSLTYVYVYSILASQSAPGPPATPSLTPLVDEIEVSWFAPASAGTSPVESYDIRYMVSLGNTYTTIDPAWSSGDGAFTYTIPILEGGTMYDIQVRAVNDVDEGEWSLPAMATALTQSVPGKPDPPTVTAGQGSLGVTWAAPDSDGGSDIIAYDLRHRIPGAGWTISQDVWATGGGSLSATIINLNPGQEYEVQVRAVNVIGEGDWSFSGATGAVGAVVPGKPTIISITPSPRQLTVAWTPPSSTGGALITSYDVRWAIWSYIDNSISTGIGVDSTYAYVVDKVNDKVYVYQLSDGVRQASREFDLHNDNNTPEGISVDTTYAYVVDKMPGEIDHVYIYRLSDGARQTSREFDLHGDNNDPRGIGVDSTYAYVMDQADDKVYVYRLSDGARQTSREFDLVFTFPIVTGISIDDAYAYLMDGVSKKVTVYRLSDGAWQASREFNLHNDNASPQGISVDSTYAYVVDHADDKVYVYRLSDGARQTSREFDLNPDGTIADPATNGGITYTILNLAGGVTYNVQVRAVNSAGDGPWSTADMGTTPVTVPGAPDAPSLIVAATTITATWDAPLITGGVAISSYDIHYRLGGNQWITLQSIWISGLLTYVISGLLPNETYAVQVKAVNSEGAGPWSGIASTTTDSTIPGKPVIVSLAPGDEGLVVQYQAPASDGGISIDNYDVQHRIRPSGSWVIINNATSGSTLSYTITGLMNGTIYEVQVRASNSVGNGAWSDGRQATPSADAVQPIVFINTLPQTIVNVASATPDITVDPPPPDVIVNIPAIPVVEAVVLQRPGKPTILTLTEAGSHKMRITWEDPDESGSHEIEYYDLRLRSGLEWTVIDHLSPDGEHEVRGLANDVEYDFQVRAVSDAGPSSWSGIHSAIPQATRVRTIGLKFMVNWDNRLWGITSFGQLYYTYDFTSGWIKSSDIPDHHTPVTAMFIYRDATGEPVIYVMTETGLWIHDLDNERFLLTDVRFPRIPDGGKGSTVWRGDLYIPQGTQVYRYGGGGTAVLSLVGPGREQGVPWPGESKIVKLEGTHNALLAAVQNIESEDPEGTSHVIAYDGVGWQSAWTPGEHEVLNDILVGTIYGDYSVWIAHGEPFGY